MSMPFLGEVKMVGFNFAPRGWAYCNGQILSIAQNTALFSLLGTTYGGNGQTTFALPDLRSRTPVHPGPTISLGQKSGEETHTLIVSEIPQHTHVAQGHTGAPDSSGPGNAAWATGGSNAYATAANATLNPASVAPTGGSQAHENMPPYLVINFVIALVGIFPSRN